MKVYIVYDIFKDYDDFGEWFDYSSDINSVYIDKNKALERATEIFNTAANDPDRRFDGKLWEDYGPGKPEDIIREYDAQ